MNSCGCDCIPWDILTYELNKELEKSGENLVKVEHFNFGNASVSGGTLETIK